MTPEVLRAGPIRVPSARGPVPEAPSTPALELLAQVPLFQGLGSTAHQRIAARFIERRLEAGEVLFREGEVGTALYVVADGEIEVLIGRGGREVTLARLGPRSHLGEMALLDDAPRSTSARATTRTTLLEVSREVFLAELIEAPGATRALLGEMARRLRGVNAMVGERLARDAVREVEKNRTPGERLADRFAAFNGSWFSIVGVLVATSAWVLLNAASDRPFDPYPFVFFNLVLGIAVALQGPLLMMSQNRQAQRDRAQAAADFQLNLKNEVALEALASDLARLERKFEAALGARRPHDGR
jgi:CRP/FNR family transcriptional regulator, cyclic AMP receptor protein